MDGCGCLLRGGVEWTRTILLPAYITAREKMRMKQIFKIIEGGRVVTNHPPPITTRYLRCNRWNEIKQELQEVLKFIIEIFRNLEARWSWPQKCTNICISTLPVISSFMKFCVAWTFWVERHLDVVLEVLQVVGPNLFFYETCRYLL